MFISKKTWNEKWEFAKKDIQWLKDDIKRLENKLFISQYPNGRLFRDPDYTWTDGRLFTYYQFLVDNDHELNTVQVGDGTVSGYKIYKDKNLIYLAVNSNEKRQEMFLINSRNGYCTQIEYPEAFAITDWKPIDVE